MATTDQGDGKTEPPSRRPPAGIFRPLGVWASLLWFVIAFVVSFVACVLEVVLALVVTNADVEDEIGIEIVTPIFVLVFIAVLVRAVRRIKWSARDYFAVVLPTRRALVIAFIGACVFALIGELLTLYVNT